jgi:hypothetical protein
MKLLLTDANSGGHLLLLNDEQHFDRFFYGKDGNNKYFTIVWNRGKQRSVTIDGEQVDFPKQTILPLMFNQSFSFEDASDLTATSVISSKSILVILPLATEIRRKLKKGKNLQSLRNNLY